MAPGCKPGGLTPYVGSNPTPCTKGENCEFGIANCEARFKFEIRISESKFEWAGVAQLVEHQPSKLRVASSNLVARSSSLVNVGWHSCPRSSGVERLLGKEEVMSSNLIAGSSATSVSRLVEILI